MDELMNDNHPACPLSDLDAFIRHGGLTVAVSCGGLIGDDGTGLLAQPIRKMGSVTVLRPRPVAHDVASALAGSPGGR
jgi:hypothetical protein